MVVTRAEEAPALPGSVAAELSNSTLEHIGQLDVVLAAVSRRVCPGGRLVITTPNICLQPLVGPSFCKACCLAQP